MRLHTRTRLKTATPTTRRPSLERDVSQLPCNTLERCPSAVRIRIAPSAARRAPASTTSREPRSTNDGGSEPAVPGDDGCSREGRAAARVGARRVESPGTRSVIEPAYRPTHPRRRAPALGRPPRGYVRRGFSRAFPSGFLARVRTARARATGGVCDAARASHALSELKRVHGRDGTRVVCVAMPRPVHHASQTATRRRSRVFRVSPVQAIWRKSIVPDEGTGGRRLRLASRGARALARTHPASLPARARLTADDPFDSIPLMHRWRSRLWHKYKMSIVPRASDEPRRQHRRQEPLRDLREALGLPLNRLPGASTGSMVMATVKKGKPDLRKKVFPPSWCASASRSGGSDGLVLYFEDNAGVIVNPKGEMKDPPSPDPWPRSARPLAPYRLRRQLHRQKSLKDPTFDPTTTG